MFRPEVVSRSFSAVLFLLVALPAGAQSFRVQCPTFTPAHPDPTAAGTQAAIAAAGPGATYASVFPGAIRCQQISGGDGYATMGDGTQTYLFGFGPLSGLAAIYAGQPGTQAAAAFNQASPTGFGTPSNLVGMPDATFAFNGAIGQVPDPGSTPPGLLDGHVDPRPIMDVGVMNANQPAPMMAIDEDDEFFLTLTNVGMIMRPDLFEQHTVHFHGYPNASSFYDGVPDASVAINIGGSFSYYYLAPDAGTYFWHCHISPPEHLQMGMVGQLYVRPRQNRVPVGSSLYAGLSAQQVDLRTRSDCVHDVLCPSPLPSADTGATRAATGGYAYNDGDGSTHYDVEYPLQIHGFDPNFHFVGMTFNPEAFVDMKDKYFLLNGRSYPDTVGGASTAAANAPGPMQTMSSDGTMHSSQPLPSVINIPRGGRALLRISDLSVTEYATLATLGVPMRVIAQNARLLRDQQGHDLTYLTNSVTLAGGESIDVLLDASDLGRFTAGQKFFLYTPNLDHLSNDAENFGGLMTEVNICTSVDPVTKACTL